jgi:LPXTG-motif cell wall-anchored protein
MVVKKAAYVVLGVTEDASGVSTGDNANSSIFVGTILGMLGIIVVLRNKKIEE